MSTTTTEMTTELAKMTTEEEAEITEEKAKVTTEEEAEITEEKAEVTTEEEAKVTTEEAKKKLVTLKSCDDVIFEVDEAVALQSQTIKHMIEDDCADNVIPLANVDSEILAMVIEYCEKHVEGGGLPKGTGDDAHAKVKELRKWDAEFVKVDEDTLFCLLLAANYLDIKNLLDLTAQTVADYIKNMTPEEVRKIFNIKNDYTPEEEEEVRKENHWAFE